MCNISKSLEDFGWRSKAKGIKNSYCKPCRREYDKEYWKKRSKASKAQKRLLSNKRVQFVRQYLYDWYKKNPCKDCGETDPVVLQSDHIEEKSFDVSTAAGRGVSIKTLQKELKNVSQGVLTVI